LSHPSAPDGRGWPNPGETRSYPAGPERGDRSAQDDGWGPSTAVYSGAASRRAGTDRPADSRSRRSDPGDRNGYDRPAGTRRSDPQVGRAYSGPPAANGWTPAGPAPGQRGADRRLERSIENLRPARPAERGVPWWGALLVLIVIAVLGGIIDTLGSISVKGGFNIGIVVASIVAILIVKRSHMFPVVIAPPIVYSAAAVFQLYIRSSGLHDRKVVLDAAANYLVYGFPAIAAATAAVLIIAGIRLISRR
jgi:hypothetical protein